MDLTPLDVRTRKFRLRFRGFDVKEVDQFLEKIADRMEALLQEVRLLKGQLRAREKELEDFRRREAALKAASSQAKLAAKDIQKNAEKEAELIISKAEVTAEKILNNAHNRLAQLHEDLAELKRQRTHFEVKLRSFIEAHLKFLDMEKESNRDLDELEDKVRFIKKS